MYFLKVFWNKRIMKIHQDIFVKEKTNENEKKDNKQCLSDTPCTVMVNIKN